MSKILVVSASLRPHSKSERLSSLCSDALADRGASVERASLRELTLPFFDDTSIYRSAGFKELYRLTDEAEGIVLCSPIYNWSTGSELKKYIECVGSSDATRRGALFDKVITFVNAAGLPELYGLQLRGRLDDDGFQMRDQPIQPLRRRCTVGWRSIDSGSFATAG